MKLPPPQNHPFIAIACGGTGGHLFPGLAIGEVLQFMGADVTLIVSEKEVDQQAVKAARGMETFTVPAVASTASKSAFFKGLWTSFKQSRAAFKKRRPDAALAMGGFTSAGPIFAARSLRIPTFLHEANSIPGRANRLLAPFVRECFVLFSSAKNRLRNRRVTVTGMPVRGEFQPGDPGAARMALGLEPDRETILIMGGSQGATAINDAFIAAAPKLRERRPDLQYLHLTGLKDIERIGRAWQEIGARAVVSPFLSEMDMALSAANLAISRAGASSLAEFAAMRTPAILIPLPTSADDHQLHNARIFSQAGAGAMVQQKDISPETLVPLVLEIIENTSKRAQMTASLAQWHKPDCADQIARKILAESTPGYSIPQMTFISALAA